MDGQVRRPRIKNYIRRASSICSTAQSRSADSSWARGDLIIAVRDCLLFQSALKYALTSLDSEFFVIFCCNPPLGNVTLKLQVKSTAGADARDDSVSRVRHQLPQSRAALAPASA
ncbi:hypothetical protein J6590_072207 [Homalodisca vitripennis]|nr:hypothetical protein J6590_072207 [Homalodisca vitripennis]